MKSRFVVNEPKAEIGTFLCCQKCKIAVLASSSVRAEITLKTCKATATFGLLDQNNPATNLKKLKLNHVRGDGFRLLKGGALEKALKLKLGSQGQAFDEDWELIPVHCARCSQRGEPHVVGSYVL